MPECVDKFGRLVSIGSRVRLIELSQQRFESLPSDEIEDVRSMTGEIFEVYEIDNYGCAWIQKDWHHPKDGQHKMHSIGLASHEMEIVDAN